MEIKNLILNNLINFLGWKSNRRIVVFESDDWGMIRMPSKKTYDNLIKKGYNLDICPYNKFDSIESNQDLKLLLKVLKSTNDINNNHAKFTINNVVANPDFEKIKMCNYTKYFYEPFTETLKKYENTDEVIDLYKQAIKENIFSIQFHCREHININRWLLGLQKKEKSLLDAFENQMLSLPTNNVISGRKNMLDSFGESYEIEFEKTKEILSTGFELFKKIWGFKSKTFIAPCYTWHPELEETLKELNIQGIQGSRVQRIPVQKSLKIKKRYHYTGQKNRYNQIYTVRNMIFEPTYMYKNGFMKEIMRICERTFKYKNPLIISSHRLNYVGRLDENNREKNLNLLTELLEFLTKKMEVEFMTSDELLNLIISGNK